MLEDAFPEEGKKARQKRWARAIVNFAEKKPAAEIGTLAHRYMFTSDEDLPEGLSKEVLNSIESWRELQESFGEYEVIYNEISFANTRFGGTPDVILKIDGEYILLEIKTSRYIKPTMAAQAAAYCKLVAPKIKISRAFVVRLGKWNPNNFQIRQIDMKGGWDLFMSAYNFWKNNNERVVFLE